MKRILDVTQIYMKESNSTLISCLTSDDKEDIYTHHLSVSDIDLLLHPLTEDLVFLKQADRQMGFLSSV